MNDSRNEPDEIIDVKRRFLSECTIPDVKILKKAHSVPELDSNTSYDDICGPWKFDNVPLHGQYQPTIIITLEDVAYMRQQRDKKLILLFLGNKGYLKNYCISRGSKMNEIFIFLNVYYIYNISKHIVIIIRTTVSFQRKKFHVIYHMKMERKKYL